MTILYIDDDGDDAEIFCEAVKRIDPEIRCIIVSKAKQVFEKLDPCPDYIFLDYRMPQYSGQEVLEQLSKTVCFKLSRIIMYSTFMSEKEMAECKRIGAYRCIQKTAHFDSLVQSIKVLLSASDQSAA